MKLTYQWSTIRRLFKYSSGVVSLFEKPIIQKYASKDNDYQPIFIVAAPRSGTTILFQLLTSYFDLLYPTNFTELAKENQFEGFWINNLLYKEKKHNSFQSTYGMTKKDGLNAPNESDSLAQTIIMLKKAKAESDEQYKIKSAEFRNLIFALINKFDKPIIFKNFVANLNIKMINEIFPDAKIIFLERDPVYTAQSLFKGHHQKGDILNKWLIHARTENYLELLKMDIHSRIVNYLKAYYEQIDDALKCFPSSNIVVLKYEELQNEFFNKMLENFKVLKCSPLRSKKISANFVKISNSINIDKVDFRKLEKEISSVKWPELKF